MNPVLAVVLFFGVPLVIVVAAVAGLGLSKLWQGYQDRTVWRNSRLENALQARRDRRDRRDLPHGPIAAVVVAEVLAKRAANDS